MLEMLQVAPGTVPIDNTIRLSGNLLYTTKHFMYLGSTFLNDNRLDKEI